jgi:NADPH:quinone reductase-like Zn-dependent oxidoreductase
VDEVHASFSWIANCKFAVNVTFEKQIIFLLCSETPNFHEPERASNDGRGADHVIEVGGAGTLPQSIEACRIGGHIALIGVLAGHSGDIPTGRLMLRQQRLQGLIVGSRKHQLDFVRALDGLALRPVIDSSFPLDPLRDVGRAFSEKLAC